MHILEPICSTHTRHCLPIWGGWVFLMYGEIRLIYQELIPHNRMEYPLSYGIIADGLICKGPPATRVFLAVVDTCQAIGYGKQSIKKLNSIKSKVNETKITKSTKLNQMNLYHLFQMIRSLLQNTKCVFKLYQVIYLKYYTKISRYQWHNYIRYVYLKPVNNLSTYSFINPVNFFLTNSSVISFLV